MPRRIPYVQQLEISDCGAACLAMTLAYHGRNVSPEDVRRATRTSRDGVNALALVEAARSYGLDARGVSVDLEGLKYLERGSILHWEFNHFVVLDRVVRGAVDVLDPALGRLRLPMDRVSKSFTGVAILLEPGSQFATGSGASRGAWRYLKPLLRQSGLLSKVAVTSFLIQLFALATPILMGVIVDRVVTPPGDRALLLAVASGMAVMVGFHLLSTFVRSHLLLALRAQLDMNISLSFISHLVKLPYQFFLQRSAGDLMARLNSNITVREILTTGAISTVLDGALVSIYLLLIFAQSATMGFVVIGLALLQIAILAFTHRPMQRVMAETLQAQARSQGYLGQIVTGIETLKSVGAESRGVAQWSNLFVDEINASLARGRLSTVIETLTTSLRVASPLIILTVGTLGVLSGDLSLGTMLALTALATGFLTPLSSLIVTGTQVQLLGSYMERINDVLDTAPEQDPADVEPAPKLGGRITLDDVSFKYADTAPEVVKNVSLEIQPGQMIGIVGKSGSGKSTLAHLILNLYKPTGGRALYDGLDLEGLDAASVRAQLGIVPQNSYLFGTSVKTNIALTKPEAEMSEIEEAARLARIHDDIMAMPMGYDTVLADGGASISGGQRQRIALARALVHQPAVLLLDEATSSLDSVTEAEIYANLEHLDCTRVVIAHRLSTIARSDLIIVMENGLFAEQGTHTELMATRGRYFELANSQARESEPSS
ncbi:MAG TPA: peptidase domain-containing ABC transporter [Actinomycetota bacterium]|nr:peptidase domain-containing ABC transporter [Actinomycetota bacterium]